MMFQQTKGQTLLEYSMIIGLVVAIIVAMGPYIGRSTQGMIKLVADEIGTQEGAEQDFNEETSQLEYSFTSTRVTSSKERKERLGVLNYIFDDEIRGTTNSSVSFGVRDK